MKTKRALFFGALCVFVVSMTWTLTGYAKDKYIRNNWECIGNTAWGGGCDDAVRLKIPGGWLVKKAFSHGIGLTFVPDENHQWKINN